MFDVVEGLRILNEGQGYTRRTIEVEMAGGNTEVTIRESEINGKNKYASRFIISKEETDNGHDELLFMMRINAYKEEAKKRNVKYKSQQLGWLSVLYEPPIFKLSGA